MIETTSQITPRLYEAMQLAFELFGRDARKSSSVPVMVHLLSVCGVVQFDGGGEDEAIAALLHDTLEDKPREISRDELEDRFGSKVLEIIEISTDTPPDYHGGPKPPWQSRKSGYLDHIRKANPSLLRVTIADKIDNCRAILADHHRMGGAVWKKFNAGRADQIWYYQESVSAYEQTGYQGPLLEELRRLVGLMSVLPE